MVLTKSYTAWCNAGMELHQFLTAKPKADREEFATRCETTLGHLNNVMYGYKPCSVELAVAIERESAGEIKAEAICPQSAETIAYLRQSASEKATA